MSDRPATVPHRSLRWRITLTVTVITALLLLVVGVVVSVLLRTTLDRDQQVRLADRTARADLLISRGTPADDLVGLLDGHGVRVEHLAADGTPLDVGPPPDGPGPDPRPGPPRPTPPHAPTPPHPPAPLETTRSLPDGTRLRLSADPGEVDEVLARFRTTMIGTGAAGILLGAGALLVGVSRSLRPLDAMTGVARAITAGDRRRRLHPTRTDTEIGRTAAAFDEMLDALDDAQRRSEASAAQARSAAEEARRSEATTRRFLSDAAHELRTPLAGAQALAETLLEETLVEGADDDPTTREDLCITMVRETSRAAALVTDMLDLARIEGGPDLQRRSVDLGALTAEQVDRIRLLAPGLAVAADVGDAPVTAFADPVRIGQILTNLLDNARRHTPPAGRVSVTVRSGDDGPVVTVHNTGRPVPAADRERIFDRLVRLDEARTRDGGGAGLGLAIARALARAHGGDLTYAAEADGSSFVLRLPAAPDDPRS